MEKIDIEESSKLTENNETCKKCLKCNDFFSYYHEDCLEILFRKYCSSKKGNLDLCLDCDEFDPNLEWFNSLITKN